MTCGLRVVAWFLAALLAVPSAALAEPWRAAAALEFQHVASWGAGASPTLRASGVGLRVRGERRLSGAPWVLAAAAEAGLAGPVSVDGAGVDDSLLSVLGVAVGAGTQLGPRWRWRAMVGPSRVFYLSPRLIGDSGWCLGLAAEATRALTRPRWIDLGISAGLAAIVGEDGGATRATFVLSLGLEVGLGR